MAKWAVFQQMRKPFTPAGWSDWEEVDTINASSEEEALIKAKQGAPEEMFKVRVKKIAPDQPVGRPSQRDNEPWTLLTVQIPSSIHKSIKRLAFEGETTMRALVILALEDFLEKN